MLKRKLVRRYFVRNVLRMGTKSDPPVKTIGYTQSLPQTAVRLRDLKKQLFNRTPSYRGKQNDHTREL